MHRRQFLRSTAGTAGLASLSATAAASAGTPSGVVWQRAYDDLAISAVVPAHDGGYLVVGRDGKYADPDAPIRLARLADDGSVAGTRTLMPETPEDARRATADVIRTDDGYAVASGPWLAVLDSDLSVETTGAVPDLTANSTTKIAEFPTGFAVAMELDTPNHVLTRLLGFDRDGTHRWTRTFGEWNSFWTGFLVPGPGDGVVVGGPHPWLASVAPDGTTRWETRLDDAPPASGHAAVLDGSAPTLFGSGSLLRLTDSRTVDWSRTYDAFADTYEGELLRTTDGGYVFAASTSGDSLRVGRADSRGNPLWSHEYEAGAGTVYDLFSPAAGEYLAVGSNRDAQDGWALRLSDGVAPTTPTTTTTPTTRTTTAGTPSTDTTPTTSTTQTARSSPTVTEQTTQTRVPGFGVGAAVAGLALGWLARRR